MKIRQPPNIHCHFPNMWTPNGCPVLAPTLGVNEDQMASDIHFRLRHIWTSIGHSIITFTCVEGWNWVATWYSTLLEMQVCIKWLPNTYPCLKHRWTSRGRPMLTLDWGKGSIERPPNTQIRLMQHQALNSRPIFTYAWGVDQDPMVIQ
jgi:hypothetical protein